MLVVRVELWSAITGEKSEIGRMVIDNIGGSRTRGDYRVRTIRGRSTEDLESGMWATLEGRSKPTRESEVRNHARLSEHVWSLVGKALLAVGYGNPKE